MLQQTAGTALLTCMNPNKKLTMHFAPRQSLQSAAENRNASTGCLLLLRPVASVYAKLCKVEHSESRATFGILQANERKVRWHGTYLRGCRVADTKTGTRRREERENETCWRRTHR